MTNAMTSGLMGPADTVEWGTPKAYFELWKKKYMQRPLDAWLYREDRA